MLPRSPRTRLGQATTLVAVGWTCLAWVWLAAIVVAPIVATSPRQAVDYSGHTAPVHRGVVKAGVTIVYATGAQLCHQQPSRSFHWRGVQAPVCGRCLGIYSALAVGLLFGWFVRPWGFATSRVARTLFALAAAPTVCSLVSERLMGVDPGNLLRALSAVPPGFVAGWLVVVALMGAYPPADHRSSSLAQRPL